LLEKRQKLQTEKVKPKFNSVQHCAIHLRLAGLNRMTCKQKAQQKERKKATTKKQKKGTKRNEQKEEAFKKQCYLKRSNQTQKTTVF
jgi:hypothetical protein